MKILLVEDDAPLREGLRDLLAAAGHVAVPAADGETALALGADPTIDLVVLDLMLPGLDGLETCRKLRAVRPALPILMLTARGSEDDKVAGLGCGADDYVTKPFGTRELLARIDALARRVRPAAGIAVLEAAGCRVDLGRLVVEREGAEPVALTAREAAILRWLFQHRERAVSRAELLERVWGASAELRTRTVDMTIANLRQKIELDPGRPRLVVTVKGIGYAWGGG